MGKINTLVVGQGLAGSVFSFMLYREQISFVVIDPGEASSASLVAAGMFTPISGQRKTIHPLTLQQIPVATNFFREAEALLACRLLHEQPVYQVFASATERDDFAAKMLQGNYAAHAVINGTTPVNVPQEFGGAAISPSGWVDCKKFILQWRRWLEGRNLLVQESFDYSLFDVTPQANKYKDIEFENIVFCEGFRGMHNPFFADQHIVPCKGEVLTVKAPGSHVDYILKRSGIYLVPTGGQGFKAGATYQWGNSSEEPDLTGRATIEATIGKLVTAAYEVTKHESGIRPTTKNREVIIAQHPLRKNMFMFNGLGTKGVLNAPWFAGKLLQQYFKPSFPGENNSAS